MRWELYGHHHVFDELIAESGVPRPAATQLARYLADLGLEELARRAHAAEMAIKVMGITFTMYSDGERLDRSWPFDIIPRVIAQAEWARTEAGLKQRIRALNAFIQDIYSDQRIIRDKVVPRELLNDSANFRPQCVGMRPAFGVWAHICGSDLVRDADGTLYVLEDNLRIPSGVSYMVENRQLAKRVFPELFALESIRPVDDYPSRLYDCLAALSPRPGEPPVIVLLTPGIYNSAYYEHAWLARQMGIDLVEAADLVVAEDACLYMKTVAGWKRVDVLYRRVDDLYVDPEVFRADSALGVPGLLRAWQQGRVALANAPGAGVADDKVIYAFVPKMIRYYLDEEPLLPNVPSYVCFYENDREFVLANLDKLVVKPANESGGHGMLIGPMASQVERDVFRDLIRAQPRNYIAQPTLNLSTVPTLIDGTLEPRHVDLRPFILSSAGQYVTTGGLTRVALRKGSLVVNSSQGGGSKDTWVVDIAGTS